jgi:dihydropteroate synthase
MKPAELAHLVGSDLRVPDQRRAQVANALKAQETPLLMGIINVTDDSFFAASRATRNNAVERGLHMWDAGALWVDVGGESTRPGAVGISIEEELARVVPVITSLRARRPDGFISVDTRHAHVAREALLAGADMVNDISGLRDPEMMEVVLERGCAVCIMHMQGEPGSMQDQPHYVDCVSEVRDHLSNARQRLIDRGHPAECIVLDPGIGFGKTQQHNIELLEAGRTLATEVGTPLLWGVSRKSIVGHLTGQADPADRLHGTLGLAVVAQRKGIDILRVHDVEPHVDLFNALNCIR